MDGCHVARLATQVYRHHDFGQAAGFFSLDEFGLERLRAEVVSARIDIYEVHLCAAVQSAVGRCHEGIGCCPEPVTGAKVQRQAGYVQSGGSAVDGNSMFGACLRQYTLLELLDVWALGQVERLQYADDGVDVSLGNILLAVTNHVSLLVCKINYSAVLALANYRIF